MPQDERSASVSRRGLLGLISVAATGFAGCFGDGGDSGTATPNADPDPGSEDTRTPTSTSTPTPTPTPGVDVTIELQDAADFEPPGTAIEPGDTVEWVNEGSVTHTVTAAADTLPDGAAYFASGGFDTESAATDGWNADQSGGIAPGESYRHTFETRGAFTYYSIPYEQDVFGQIQVGNATPTPTPEN